MHHAPTRMPSCSNTEEGRATEVEKTQPRERVVVWFEHAIAAWISTRCRSTFGVMGPAPRLTYAIWTLRPGFCQERLTGSSRSRLVQGVDAIGGGGSRATGGCEFPAAASGEMELKPMGSGLADGMYGKEGVLGAFPFVITDREPRRPG